MRFKAQVKADFKARRRLIFKAVIDKTNQFKPGSIRIIYANDCIELNAQIIFVNNIFRV